MQEVGIAANYARTVGIAVDLRRKNRSQERLNENVQRLKEYKARLVVLPKKIRVRKGDKAQAQPAQPVGPVSQATGFILPIVKPTLAQEVRAITAEEKAERVFVTLRKERARARLAGKRQKWALEKEAEEAVSAKK